MYLHTLSHVIVHVNLILILIYGHNQDNYRKSYFIGNAELWNLLQSTIFPLLRPA